ncbi:MAG: ubiquitin-conjugating enzyme E2 [Candidatus Kariarchaeaceae archaeon]
MDTDLITAQEFDWIVNNEPTFRVDENSFVGKIGRTESGRDILIKITLPAEYYPIVKPSVSVITEMQHPNINPDQTLALQLLDEWEPRYRLKDVIISARRLFLRSKNLIREVETTPVVVESSKDQGLKDEIAELQAQIQDHTQKINQLTTKKLEGAGVKTAMTGSVTITAEQELKASQKALQDLIGLIEFKFEDASMDEVVFFRLYRKYIREEYIVNKKLTNGGNNHVISEQKTKRPLRN